MKFLEWRMVGSLVFGLFCVLFVPGCGADTAKADAVGKDMVRLMNEQADVIDGMAKNPTADNIKAGQEKLKTVLVALEAKQKEYLALPALGQAHADRVYKAETEQAVERVKTAAAALKTATKTQ